MPTPTRAPEREIKPSKIPVQTPPPTRASTPGSTSNPTIETNPEGPVLSDGLKRDCQITQGTDDFENTGLIIGETAVNFTLMDIHGIEYRLSQLLNQPNTGSVKPVVMVFGSFTCPPFRQRVVATEQMHTKYGNSVQFIMIYIIEAHPVGSVCPYTGEVWTTSASTDKGGNPLTQPSTYQERVAQSKRMVQELGITIPLLIDEMDNPIWCTYGPAPNIAYLIGKNGKIIAKQGWYEPQLMQKAIEKYLSNQ
jgi:hypothetical protein